MRHQLIVWGVLVGLLAALGGLTLLSPVLGALGAVVAAVVLYEACINIPAEHARQDAKAAELRRIKIREESLDERQLAREDQEHRHRMEERQQRVDLWLAVTRASPEQYLLDYEPARVTPLHSLTRVVEEKPHAQEIAAHDFPAVPLTRVVEELPVNGLTFAFGTYRATGELVQTTLPDALHIQVTGATGQGKSVGAQGLITQLAATNDTAHLEFGFLDPEGDTCVPFHRLPHVAALATNADQAAKELHRMRLLLDTRPIGPQCALLIFIEEFLSLQRMMSKQYREQALDDFTEIALRGRRRYMYLLVLGQTAYREKDLRDAQRQFQSVLTYALHPDAVRAAGMTGNNEALRQLWRERRKGQFLLQSPGQFGDQLVLAPHTTALQIAQILGGSQVVPEQFPVTSQVVPIDAYRSPVKLGGKQPELDNRTLALVRELVSQQKSQNEIIQVAFPNMRNAEAIAEYRRYLSYLVLKEDIG